MANNDDHFGLLSELFHFKVVPRDLYELAISEVEELLMDKLKKHGIHDIEVLEVKELAGEIVSGLCMLDYPRKDKE